MTTITIDYPKLEEKYTKEELKTLITDFLKSKLNQDNIDLFEISINDLTPEQLDAYNNRNNIKYINL